MENKNTIVLSAEMDMEIEEVKASMKGNSTGIPEADVLVTMATLVIQKKPHTTAWLNESSYNYKILTEALVNGYEVAEEFTDAPIDEETEMEKGKVTIEIDFTGEGVQIQFNGNPNDYQKAIQTVVKNEKILEFIAHQTVEEFGVEEDTEKVCCMSGGSCPFGGERFFANLLGLQELPKELKEAEEYQEFIKEMKEVYHIFKMFGHPFGEADFKNGIPEGAFADVFPFLQMMPQQFTAHASQESIFATLELIGAFIEENMIQEHAEGELIEFHHGDVVVINIKDYQKDVRFFVVKNEKTGQLQLMATNLTVPFRIPDAFKDSDTLIEFLENYPRIEEWDILGNVNDAEPQVS
ncbi:MULTISPECIES: hypothetical protein [Bacillus]|uniref:Uncharacterized protein n=2 Tax=Bacillus thuringiensis TaxID=1428 RepID=A0AAP4V263_BACTU|nr:MULTISPECIES: hypothetical protein [Bacillus]MEC0046450.1 hypothetical protein [Bacillus cereus]AFV21816.1 hypothetical protein BTB_502p05110 [Bacillus thuringiensis Bt407]EEM25158.1 hypothetical protein bthur0002_58000 [Bacillus thuringiensis Bt407]ERI01007.1 hypothetical protein BTCBT_002562 [Bacillus thuringiensis T01-328]MBN6707770.1 hypothetical protein [Bacillus thuringiensis]